jgi:hypothetical protein
MERIEHVEVRVGIEEVKKLLGVPAGASVEAFAKWADVHGNFQAAQANAMQYSPVISIARCAPGTPIHELRITFTKAQEEKAP